MKISSTPKSVSVTQRVQKKDESVSLHQSNAIREKLFNTSVIHDAKIEIHYGHYGHGPRSLDRSI